MASLNTNLPQEGTSSSAGGESLPAASAAGSPAYSGGGKDCYSNTTTTLATEMDIEASGQDVVLRQEESGGTSTSTQSGRDQWLESLANNGRTLRVMLTRCDSFGMDSGATASNTEFDSDSSAASYMSGVSGESYRRAFLKRGRGPPSDPEETSGAAPVKGAALKLKRGRGRPFSVDADTEVAASLRTAREARATIPSGPAHLSLFETEEDQTSVALNKCVEASLKTIIDVATKSTNIKGTLVKALKEAAANIKAAVSQLRERTMSEEVARLETANARLHRDMEELRRELMEMKRRPAQPDEPDIQKLLDEVSRANVATFGSMLNARLAGLEERLLPDPRRRPPLAADRRTEGDGPPASLPKAKQGAKKKGPATKEPLPSTSGTGAQDRASIPAAAPGETPSTDGQPPKAPPKRKRKGKQPSLAAREAAQARDRPAPTPAEATWATVAARGAKKAAKKATKGPNKASPPERKAKLRAPKTAAVTLTLAPGAEESGVTYAAVLTQAKSRIKLAELGIRDIKFRKAATGARMLEVGGEAASEKADSLATKLREVLGPELVRVARPVKRAELRVTGLDDSATAAEVVEAVAREGGCAADNIRPGRLVFGPRGDGSLWLSVPVAAAKKVTDTGRVRVGWTSARVVLLPSRPTRCFRCLETGHMGVTCSCEVDRSKLCFRCGKPDHRARDCSADPNCPVCEAAKKPAGHSVGGNGCVAAGQKPALGGRGAPKSRTRRNGVERMDTSS
ncbi:PREDICTED: uncharacterized protein LOC106127473 [Papilio xuthus]|uniref:Uncharacterized protein LOC106127473 n=1 Tax=Papilio xuthus TaxID=66420 RepID=A0AAJ6ZXF7_PAPXU|nr:PREDICTED: uncharacterized protein LOC106127473 [Papilio xuthus]